MPRRAMQAARDQPGDEDAHRVVLRPFRAATSSARRTRCSPCGGDRYTTAAVRSGHGAADLRRARDRRDRPRRRAADHRPCASPARPSSPARGSGSCRRACAAWTPCSSRTRTGITSTCLRSNVSGRSCRSSARTALPASCGGSSFPHVTTLEVGEEVHDRRACRERGACRARGSAWPARSVG